MRTWLLTSTTYGTWLPGDRRGSVTSVRDSRPGDGPAVIRFEHDLPGEPYEEAIPELEESARLQMNGPPVFLDRHKAAILLAQLQETARYRGWALLAVAIMSNHFHIVVSVPGDPAPGKILGDFKAYGSRTLTRKFGRPVSGTWWTAEGSKRVLKNHGAVPGAIEYVLKKQPHPLITWSPETPGAPLL